MFQIMSVLDDIGNILNVIVSPFKLIFNLIGLLTNAIAGIFFIIANVGSIIISICRLLPSPMFEMFVLYCGVYFSIITFKVVKGII